MAQRSRTEPVIRVDSHTHILPLPLARSIRVFFNRMFDDPTLAPPPTSCCSSSSSFPFERPTFAYDIEPVELVRVLREEHEHDEEEAAAAWVLPYAHKAGMSRKLNASIKAMCEELSDARLRLVVGATVHPADGEGANGGSLKPEEVLEEALAGGAKVAKLHCSVGGYDVLDSRLSNFFRLAEAARLPVVIHGGISIRGTTAAEDLAGIGPLCRAYPHLPVVLAHAGAPATASALLLTALHPNLYLDTTPVLTAPIRFPIETPPAHLLALALEGRIVFGSDSPTTTFLRAEVAESTRGWIRVAVAKCVGALEIEDMNAEMGRVGEEAERMVFGEAALRLEAGVRTLDEAKKNLVAKREKGKL